MSSYKKLISSLIEGGSIPPFVYCYPTRSSYRPLKEPVDILNLWEIDRQYSLTEGLNLYIHVPFCRYKCGFCNLYTIISTDDELHDRYIASLCNELDFYKEVIQTRKLQTIYIGGGTPTLLSYKHFAVLFGKISEIYPNWQAVVEEVAIEASPDSIVKNPSIAQYLIDLGITRMNLGIQSLSPSEIRFAGRNKANEDVVRAAIAILKKAKLPNLSTDLINGFSEQTDESWEFSVNELLKLSPETISTYFLTVRPDAWFSKTGRYLYNREPGLYKRYDLAREKILAAGYVQESDVRYKKPGLGGYRQKVLHFQGTPYLGIGVGARTYNNTCDYLLSGGNKPSPEQVLQYMQEANSKNLKIRSGYIFNDEERIRKRLVLDLFDLSIASLENYHVRDYKWIYEDILEAVIDLNLARDLGGRRVQLTPKGYKYRGIVSWLFFSEKVRKRDAEFYETLHNKDKQTLARLGRFTHNSETLKALPQ